MRISFFNKSGYDSKVLCYRFCLALLLIGLLLTGIRYVINNNYKIVYSSDNEAARCIQENLPQYVYASGRVIGIHENTSGVLVVDTDCVEDEKGKECYPAKGKIYGGDYITAINNYPVETKKEIVALLSSLSQEKCKTITLSITRNDKRKDIELTPIKDKNKILKLGIWIKDDMAGIGTMTYYTDEGKFGALGHGIGDGTTDGLLKVGKGEIYTVSLSNIIKGKEGEPGELSGVIYCGTKSHIGGLENNTPLGIYGELDEEDLNEFKGEDYCYEVCPKEEIAEGEAYIISDISGELKQYKITITDINLREDDSNDGIRFEVNDEELLNLTGGIVQGMSGSPLVKNGKIIGAVTHVLVNDPTKGYGIFIETMLVND